MQRWEAVYAREWKYFATSEMLTSGGRPVQGLALPPEVVRKIFHDNALRWIPGLKSAACCGGTPVD